MKKPLTPKEATSRIRKAVKHKKIVLAPNKATIALAPYINKVMAALGFEPEDVLITDESTVGDFRTIDDRQEFRAKLDEISNTLGVEIKYEWKLIDGHYHVECDYIIDIARKLRYKDKSGIA